MSDGLLQHIENAERQARRDGFHVTAHALNVAKKVCGRESEIEQTIKDIRKSECQTEK